MPLAVFDVFLGFTVLGKLLLRLIILLLRPHWQGIELALLWSKLLGEGFPQRC